MFNSPEQALSFAFRVRQYDVLSVPSAMYNSKQAHSTNREERLSQYDLHAQSGLIFSWLSRRPFDEQIYAFLIHGNNVERRTAALLFARQSKAMLKKFGLSNYALRQAILGGTVREVSADSGLSHYRAWKFRRELAGFLLPIQDRLMSAMYDELIDLSHTAS